MNNDSWTTVDFAVTNMRCMSCFPSLLATWLPDGKEIGGEWVALNPTRQDRRAGSFKVNVKTGTLPVPRNCAIFDGCGPFADRYSILDLAQPIAF